MDLGTWLRLHWDRGLAVVCMAIGAVALVAGWMRASGTPYPAEQLPLVLSAGIGGLFVLGLGATFWLSSDLRDEWSKLDSIDQALRELSGTSGTGEDRSASEHRNGVAPDCRPEAASLSRP